MRVDVYSHASVKYIHIYIYIYACTHVVDGPNFGLPLPNKGKKPDSQQLPLRNIKEKMKYIRVTRIQTSTALEGLCSAPSEAKTAYDLEILFVKRKL